MGNALAKNKDRLAWCKKETNLESAKMTEAQWKLEQKELNEHTLDEKNEKRGRSRADSMLGLSERENDNEEWKRKLTKVNKASWKLRCKTPREITKTATETKAIFEQQSSEEM